MTLDISKTFYFEMAHRLTFHEGGCRNIHGHSYKVEVFLQGEKDGNGMILDYSDVKTLVRTSIIDNLDHCLAVYEKDELLKSFISSDFKTYVFSFETTAENLSEWIFNTLYKIDNRIQKVILWETQNNKATYTR